MPEPGPSAPEPDDVPDIVEMTAAAINNNDNHGVTWDKVRRSTADRYRRLARRTLNAVAPEIERQFRERMAAELETLRDDVVNKDKPYNQAFMHGVDCAIRTVRGAS